MRSTHALRTWIAVAALSGCAPLEPETTWEQAWGALDQEELRVSLYAQGALARGWSESAPPPGEQATAWVRGQLAYARAGLATRALVDATIDDVRLISSEVQDGRATVRWSARLTARRPAGAASDEASTLAFALLLPEDPIDVLARGGAACATESTIVESEAALADAFDPSRADCTLPLASADLEVVEATATSLAERSCRAGGLKVARNSYSHRTYGYSFSAKIAVAGEALDECEIRQLVTVRNARTEWDGTPTPEEKIREGYERGLWDGIDTGRWVVDTAWDWQDLDSEGRHSDSQLHNVPNRRGQTADGSTRTEVQLDQTARRFLVQVRDRSTGSMRAIRLWRYSWSNADAKLDGQPYAGADVALGRFSGCLGITGVGEMNAPKDDCP